LIRKNAKELIRKNFGYKFEGFDHSLSILMMSSAIDLLTPPKPKRQKVIKLRTPPKATGSRAASLIQPPAPHARPLSSIGLTPPVISQPRRTPSRHRRKPRVNQTPSTPITTPRRKPQTPRHPLRSSRNSPPRFGNDNLDNDDPVNGGSPLPFDCNDSNNDFGYGDNMDFERILDEANDEGILELELSSNKKNEAIIEIIKKIVPDYWNILQQDPYSHARISKRCLIIQEFDTKSGFLKVF
jgi:hypothetical protein